MPASHAPPPTDLGWSSFGGGGEGEPFPNLSVCNQGPKSKAGVFPPISKAAK